MSNTTPGQYPVSGDIGVGCSRSQMHLWIHLANGPMLADEAIAQHNSSGYIGPRTAVSSSVWSLITSRGKELANNTLALDGVMLVGMRPDRMSIQVDGEHRWRSVLPTVVGFALVILAVDDAVVYCHAGDVDRPSSWPWHLPLLGKLFPGGRPFAG